MEESRVRRMGPAAVSTQTLMCAEPSHFGALPLCAESARPQTDLFATLLSLAPLIGSCTQDGADVYAVSD